MHSTDRQSDNRVLVGEPSPAIRCILQQWLSEWGYCPTFFEDGIDAWKALQEVRPPKLVILNQVMPRLSAPDLCRRLRHAHAREALPYVVVMACGRESQSAVPAIEAGADEFISWPIEKDELRARLLSIARMIATIDDLVRSRDDLRVQATCDNLTGVWNRTAFLELFQRELKFASRAHSSCGLLLLDMDRFKKINDTYGHLAGDAVLKEIANRLRRNIRPYDFVGRFGGEEFLVAIRGCNRQQMREQAERLRLAVSAAPVIAEDAEIWTTVSIGAAIAEPSENSSAAVIAAADSALYKAKKAGRNRIASYEKLCKGRLTHAAGGSLRPIQQRPAPVAQEQRTGPRRASTSHRL